MMHKPSILTLAPICLCATTLACADGPPGSADDSGTGTTDAPLATETDGGDGDMGDAASTSDGGDVPPIDEEGSTGGSGDETGEPPPETCDRMRDPARTIWLAEAGALVKVDAPTMTILARYALPPDVIGPGQISANLDGDVAVALGASGVMMIHGDPDRCPDPTATSRGPDDVRPFPDGCVGWISTAVAPVTTVTWTTGSFDEETCRWRDADLWVIGEQVEIGAAILDGEGGQLVDLVRLPLKGELSGRRQIAVDAEGSLWGTSDSELFRVDADLQVRIWTGDVPREGRVLVADENTIVACGGETVVFDPQREAWHPFGALLGDCTADLVGATFGLDMLDDAVVRIVPALHQIGGPLAQVPAYSLDVDDERFVWALAIGPGASILRIDIADGSAASLVGVDVPVPAVGDLTGVALRRVAPAE